MSTIRQYGTWCELTLTSTSAYENPLWDVEVAVTFTSPSGTAKPAVAFWDGGDTWRARVETLEAGSWSYASECCDTCNEGLHGIGGAFAVVGAAGAGAMTQTPLYQHGGLSAQAKGFRLAYADGTPFFWMADTVWNGILKSAAADWDAFLEVRRAQGFTAVQCVLTQWRAFPHDAAGDKAFEGIERIRINPAFFQRLDDKVAAVNRHGLVAALVLLWSCTPIDVGHYLPEGDALRLARYIVARYGCHQVVWFLGGDGEYRGDHAAKWQRIGRALFGGKPDRPVTMHPGGQHWVADEFRDEPWFTFLGYQSGHGDSPEYNAWLVHGGPSKEWRKAPVRPIIDLEPCYEGHRAYNSHQFISARKARRSLYWNLLIAPCAGVTYGNHGVWPWVEQREVPMDHEWSGETDPWYQVLRSEGAQSVAHLRLLFDSLEWWRLQPAPDLVKAQPCPENANLFVAAAVANDSSFAVIYLPEGGPVTLVGGRFRGNATARWFNPRTGQWSGPIDASSVNDLTFEAPAGDDWVLVISSDLFSRHRLFNIL